MESVTVTRTVGAEPPATRAAMSELEPFMAAAGFDEVTVEGGTIRIRNRVGIADIELVLDLVEGTEADLVYEQREGIFDEMRTRYDVAAASGGSEVTATTRFAVGAGPIGDLLDATIIRRQRRKELDSQFDWLDEAATD